MQQNDIKDILKEIFLINGNDGDLWEKMIYILNNRDDQLQGFFSYMKSSVLIKPNKALNLDILDYIGDNGNKKVIYLLSSNDFLNSLTNLLRNDFFTSPEIKKKVTYLIQKWSFKYKNEFNNFKECFQYLISMGVIFPSEYEINEIPNYAKYLILHYPKKESKENFPTDNLENDKNYVNIVDNNVNSVITVWKNKLSSIKKMINNYNTLKDYQKLQNEIEYLKNNEENLLNMINKYSNDIIISQAFIDIRNESLYLIKTYNELLNSRGYQIIKYNQCFPVESHTKNSLNLIKHDFEKIGNTIEQPFKKAFRKIKNIFESSKNEKKSISDYSFSNCHHINGETPKKSDKSVLASIKKGIYNIKKAFQKNSE